MNEEEIVERGLIAYCIIYLSEHVILNIVVQEKVKQLKKEGETNMSYFGPLKCNRCKKEITEIARSLSGDDRIYCQKCWSIVKKEAERKG